MIKLNYRNPKVIYIRDKLIFDRVPKYLIYILILEISLLLIFYWMPNYD